MINILKIIERLFICKSKLATNKALLDILDVNIYLPPEEFAIYVYKIQNKIIQLFDEDNSKEILQILSYIQRIYTQMEIYYSAVIGNNLKIVHGLGTVIGARVVIGDNVVIYQNVTLGDKGDNTRGRPTIGDNTIIGAGSIILGGITIGKNSIVGASSVVLNSFPENSVIAGMPAKIIKKNIKK